MQKLNRFLLVCAILFAGTALEAQEDELISVLIVDGQNNHGNWPTTTEMMKNYLLESGKFAVDIARTKPKGQDETYAPKFSDYHVVVSNYNGAPWPEKTKQAFVEFVRNGGGFVSIHAADNAFPRWKEYNEIIGLGGWGGRNEKSGPYVYYNEAGKPVRDTSKGNGGHHGRQHEFTLIKREPNHPIMKDVPSEWLHMKDELYDKLRGPAENMKILATSFAAKKFGGSGRHEPMLMTLSYGKGRVFHTPMGHGNYSQECVGFITLFLRGTQWAATGEVDIPIPEDFPSATATSSRKFTPPAKADMKSLKQAVQSWIKLADENKGSELLERMAVPSELAKMQTNGSPLTEIPPAKLEQLKGLLKQIDFEKVELDDKTATYALGGGSMTFKFIDGKWHLSNRKN